MSSFLWMTDIDVGGTDNTDLTFNIADRLTRVDYEDNSYRIYTHDDNGNCTKEEFYSGQYLMSPVVVPTLSSPVIPVPVSSTGGRERSFHTTPVIPGQARNDGVLEFVLI